MNALQISNLDNFKTQNVFISETFLAEKVANYSKNYFGEEVKENKSFDLPSQGFKTGIEREDVSINRSYPNINKKIEVLRAKNAVVLWLKNQAKSSFHLAEHQPAQGQYSTKRDVYEVVIFKIDPSKPFYVRLEKFQLGGTKELVFKG